MIICPNCQHKEMSGAIYCSNCGAQLIEMTNATHKIHSAEARQEVQSEPGRIKPPPPVHMQSWISLNMIESGQILPLADQTELTLGRSEDDQPIIPDVDLTPFKAYANGVSRLHASLKLIQDQIVIMDLGSSNGTFLNGNRLSPYVDTQVTHGDVIHLGKLEIQLLIE
jgi:hypothetical protein